METGIIAALVSGVVSLVGYLVTTDRTRRQIAVEKDKIKVALGNLQLRKQELDINSKTAESQIEHASQQLALKQSELTMLQSQLEQGLEDIRQEQFSEVLKSRLDAYPQVYSILQQYNRIWKFYGKPFDHTWATQFLEAILECNRKYGVLFSQNVYSHFCRLRDLLEKFESRLRDGGVASNDDLESIDSVISGPLVENCTKRNPGLGSYMKNDLGSYRSLAIEAR